jgi:hypothetical protein
MLDRAIGIFTVTVGFYFYFVHRYTILSVFSIIPEGSHITPVCSDCPYSSINSVGLLHHDFVLFFLSHMDGTKLSPPFISDKFPKMVMA